LFLTVATATVLIGTLYPLVLETIGGAKISVGPPYFNLTFAPLMAVLAVLVPFGPLLAWKRGDIFAAMQRLWAAGLIALVIMAVMLAFMREGPYLAVLGLGLAAWLVVGSISEVAYRIKLFTEPFGRSLNRLFNLPRSALGTALAHGGLGVLIAGVTGISAWKEERIQAMTLNESINVSGYEFLLKSVESGSGPNYALTSATVEVTRGGRQVVTMMPEKRFYPVAGTSTTEAAIHTTIFADIYVVLGEAQGEDASDGWAVRIYYNPLVIYVWIGAVIMAFGGMISLSDRRLRVGLPAPRRSRAAPVPAE
jgi:cytochrome c-type biogenesis protein CcmF